jgi:hypothetical protein
MLANLRALKMELRKRLHDPVAATGTWLNLLLKGHLNYFAVSGNSPSLWWFFNEVRWLWLRSLRRRSQKAFLNWEKFIRLTGRFFPPVKIVHALPLHRFDAEMKITPEIYFALERVQNFQFHALANAAYGATLASIIQTGDVGIYQWCYSVCSAKLILRAKKMRCLRQPVRPGWNELIGSRHT